MKIYKAPDNIPSTSRGVFLAGSIEMGEAEDWQKQTGRRITSARNGMDVYNPRRDDWDGGAVQHYTNPYFCEQVTWELDALDQAVQILLYFDPTTKSPISLLELGLYAQSGKLAVACPRGFWRRGNVQMVCIRYGIPYFESLSDMLDFYFPEIPTGVVKTKNEAA